MANTMVKIASVTVGVSGASTIDFTSIPQSFTDLKVVLSVRSARTGSDSDDMLLSFNGSTSSFSNRFMYSNGASTVSSTGSSGRYAGTIPASTSTASIFGNAEIYIFNYTSVNNKSFNVESASENNGTTAYTALSAGLWSNTAAITSISLSLGVGPGFAQYSSATLYGILKA